MPHGISISVYDCAAPEFRKIKTYATQSGSRIKHLTTSIGIEGSTSALLVCNNAGFCMLECRLLMMAARRPTHYKTPLAPIM